MNNNDIALYAYSGVRRHESELKKKIKELGGSIWTKKDDNLFPSGKISALIVGEMSGTEKLHAALATGIPILHIDYVHDSHRAGRFLTDNWENYDLGHSRFAEMRVKQKFIIDPIELRQKTASEGGVYKDWRVVVLMQNTNSKRVYDHLLRIGGAQVKQWTVRHLLDLDQSKLRELTHIFSEHSLLLNPSFQKFLEKNISGLYLPVLVNFYITKILSRKVSSRRDFCLLSEKLIENQVEESVKRGEMLDFARRLRKKRDETEVNKKFNGVGDPSLNQETSSPVYGILVPSLTAPLRPRNKEKHIRLVKEEDSVGDEPVVVQPSSTVSQPVQDPFSIYPPSPEYRNTAISPHLKDPFSIYPPSPEYRNTAISPHLQDHFSIYPPSPEYNNTATSPHLQQSVTEPENTTRPPASPSYEPEDDSLFPVRDTPLSPGKDDIKSKRQLASESFDVVPSAAVLPPPTSGPVPASIRSVPVPTPVRSVPVPVPVRSVPASIRSDPASIRSGPASIRSVPVPVPVRSVPTSIRSVPLRSHDPVPLFSVPVLDSVPNPVPDLSSLPLPVPTTDYSINHQALSDRSSSPSPPPSVDRRGGGFSSRHPTSPLSAAAGYGVGSRRGGSVGPSSQIPADSGSECRSRRSQDMHSLGRSRKDRHSVDSPSLQRGFREHTPEPLRRNSGSQDRHGSSRSRGSQDMHSLGRSRGTQDMHSLGRSSKDRHSVDSQSLRRGFREHMPEPLPAGSGSRRHSRGSQDRHSSSRSRGSRDQHSERPSQPLPRDCREAKDSRFYQPPPLRLGGKEVSNAGFKGATGLAREVAGTRCRPRSSQDTVVSPELLEARAENARLQRELQQARAQGSQQRGDTQPPPGQKRRRERRNTQTDDEDIQILRPSPEVEVLGEEIKICEDDDVEVVTQTSKSTFLEDKRRKLRR